MDANDLGRWTRFALKGGIGKCFAVQDCVAEEAEDLMFLKDDEIIVLMQLQGQEDTYLGYCEGVVGRFRGRDVRFNGRLKKPIMAKRSSRSLSRSSSRPSSSQGGHQTRETRDNAHRDSPLPVRSISHSSSGMTLTMQDTPTTSPNPSAVSSPLLVPSSGQFGDGNLHVRSASHSSSSTAIDSAPRTPADFGKEDAANLVRIASLSRQVDSPTDFDEEHANLDKRAADPARDVSPDSPSGGLQYGGDDHDNEDSFEEPSTRISIALSDGDGETGIGLSLLQDMAGEDDADSIHSSTSGAPTPAADDFEKKPTPSIRSVAVSERPSVYSSTSPKLASDAALSPTSPSSAPASPRSVVSTNSISRNSVHPSMMSATDSDYCGEEWEGASDIYDNYRYSRYSMASRASRLSKASLYTVGSFALEAPPPVPFDGRRPSLDSIRQNFGLGRERLNSNATASSVEDVRRTSPLSPASPKETGTPPEGKRVPPPLELKSSNHGTGKQPMAPPPSEPSSSPLLHGSFNSPMVSPAPASATFSPVSPTSNGPFSQLQGAASALRQRLELERGSRPSTPGEGLKVESQPNARLSTQPIVVEDDEPGPVSSQAVPVSPPATAVPMSPPASQPTSPSQMSEKRRLIETTLIIANQPAPPPPYTPMSSEFDLDSPRSPPLVNPYLQGPTSPPLDNPYPRSSQDQTNVQTSPEPQAVPRPRTNLTVPQNEFVRRSLFAPHPHAPKPVPSPTGPSGPMYGRHQPAPVGGQQGHGGTIQSLHAALVALRDPARRGRVTLYAKFDHNLGASVGPVPVQFVLDPPNNVPANKLRAMTLPNNAAAGGEVAGNGAPGPAEPSMPRAQFFPKELKEGKSRPRSRSFSGFDSAVLKDIASQSSDDGDSSLAHSASLNALTGRSKSDRSSSLTGTTAPPGSAPRPVHRPSPLSLSQNNVVAPLGSTSPRSAPLSSPKSAPLSPRSPRTPSSNSSPSPRPTISSPTSPVMSNMSLGQASDALSPPIPSSPLPQIDTSSTQVMRSVSGSSDHHSVASTSPLRYRPKHMLRHSRSSNLSGSNSNIRLSSGRDDDTPSRASTQGRQSVESDASSDVRSVVSPVPSLSLPMPQHTVRSKLSLPALKIKASDRSLRSVHSQSQLQSQEERSPTSSIAPSLAPSVTPSMTPSEDTPRVQIKDVDFEMVMPAGLSVIEEDRSSSPLPLPSPGRPEFAGAGSSFRSASPAFSMFSAMSSRTAPPPSTSAPPPDLPSTGAADAKPAGPDVEAHRQRELRWINTIASVPAAQARKNKKVRKLLWDGVPASVRYIVWAHLTDSKAKRIENVYYRLTQRDRVPAAASIERDLRRVFPEEGQLHDGSLLNVLQAYLTMVPDIHYSRGLTVIAGHLLLQSPEEDAFWTFVSLMDTHLRSYFSASQAQMEIDATLFGKAVEANDAAVAKKVFVDMDIPPASLCRPWFTALFLEALPLEHSERVWDIFLFEGVPFLFRVGLAIVSRCRPQVLQLSERDAILNLLLHPPSALLPPTADAFLEIAAAVKLKDDDVRKQRVKLFDAHTKRQNHARNANLASQSQNGPAGVPTISLPRH